MEDVGLNDLKSTKYMYRGHSLPLDRIAIGFSR
jgi:hypothetical protein